MKALALIAALVLCPVAALANCGDRAIFIEVLGKKFGAVLHAYGLGKNSTVFELYVSPITHEWAALVTYEDGRTCLTMAGDGLEFMPVVLGEGV